MRRLHLVVLLALRALATPQPSDVPEHDESNLLLVDGLEIDGNIIIKPVFDILSNSGGRVDAPIYSNEEQNTTRRGFPANPATISALDASKAKAPSLKGSGLFYRGDPRHFSEIFRHGFEPQGHDMNLRNHLNFVGRSGFVSVTRSSKTAEVYAFGRTDAKTEKGYIYVIAPNTVPDGYWVPGIYPPEKNPAIRRNMEFAVAGAIGRDNIVAAYEISRNNPGSWGKQIRNENYGLKALPACSARKRMLCDPAKVITGVVVDKAKGTKGKSGSHAGRNSSGAKSKYRFRTGAMVGSALAFQVLSPYAHDVLDMAKEWDNPIGRGLTWFDKTVTSFQESIGGRHVPEVEGNEFRLKIVCWMRGEQPFPLRIDRACQRLGGAATAAPAAPKPDDADLRLRGLNQILRACEGIEQTMSASDAIRFEMLQRCDAFHDKAAALEIIASEAAEAEDEEAWNGESIPASDDAEDDVAEAAALGIKVLFQGDSTIDGGELCWSASTMKSTKPPDWELVLAVLYHFNKKDKSTIPCRACRRKNYGWTLHCASGIKTLVQSKSS